MSLSNPHGPRTEPRHARGPDPRPMARREPVLYAARPMARCLPIFFVISAMMVGCAPGIGDSCSVSADCSVNGDRICDTAQPNGYCTVRGCDPDTCPDSALCVEWRFDPPRTAETWCMQSCSNDGDCRRGAGYRCVHATLDPDGEDNVSPELMVDGEPIARITDLKESRRRKGFCAAVATEEVRDGGPRIDASFPDSGSDAGNAPDASEPDGGSDAGPALDGGPDAGPEPDGGTADAGPEPDAGPDAGPEPDAGPSAAE